MALKLIFAKNLYNTEGKAINGKINKKFNNGIENEWMFMK